MFQYYYADIRKAKPLGSISLQRFLESIKAPKDKNIKLFEAIEKASTEKNEALRLELKQQLYSFTPSVNLVKWRKYENIQSFNGLAVLDFDKIENPIEFKTFLFEKYSCIIACWLSPSKRGVKAFISIPVCSSVTEYKDYYRAIATEFKQYKGFDGTPINPVLPLFLSYDRDLLERTNYTTWQKKETAPVPIIQPIRPNYKTNELDKKRVFKIVESIINKVTNEGHPEVVKASLLIGGYIASNTVNEHEAIQLINQLIDSNSYLVQKSEVYKKTALTMIEHGKASPKYLTQNLT